MFWSFCAPKSGLGTSVVTAAVALESARRARTVVIDFGGDLAHIFGVDADAKPGVHDWLAASDDVGAESLEHLTLDVAENLALMPMGGTRPSSIAPERAVHLVEAMNSFGEIAIADTGAFTEMTDPRALICASGDRTTCVLRACYLAMRRFSKLPVVVDDVAEIQEPGRALSTLDIEAVVDMPVAARIPLAPSISRAVDAGLLSSRMPRSLRRNVRLLIEEPPMAVIR